MREYSRFLPVLIFQAVPLILFPPNLLQQGLIAVGVVVLIFVGLGYAILRRRLWALTLSIMLQGLNIVVRMMMFFPNSVSTGGNWDLSYVLTNVLAIVLSSWFLLRLDRADFQAMVQA